MNGEAGVLRHFLDAQRASVLAIVAGLDDEQLTTSLVGSGWTPLGLIEHLGFAERHWFQEMMLGAADPLPWPTDQYIDDGNPCTTSRSTAIVFAFYCDQVERSNQVLELTSLDTVPVGVHDTDLDDDITDLRWIVLHMIEETARHAGHLDIARELLDGRTGLGPR